MDLSKLQIIALVILTTILTDKFLITHTIPTPVPSTPMLSPSPIPTISNQNEIILRELANLRKDIIAYSSSPKPSLTASALGGMVKIDSTRWKNVDVFEKPLSSSKIIDNLIADNIYFYQLKKTDWSLITLDSGQSGWVQTQFLQEFP